MSHKHKKSPQFRSTKEDAFFAASNSERGFCSYYSDCFDNREINRVFVIKGGPGTGKSRFMREVGENAAARGWERRMIYCSSDSDSLDGIILRRGETSIALLDGTAPHTYEPKSPGVREEWINLGDFWNASALRERADEISVYQQEKQKGYRVAYRYLSAYGSVYRSRREKLEPYLRRKALEAYAKRLMRKIPDGARFESETALIGSVGMQGNIRLDTYFAESDCCYEIEDCKGVGAELMAELYRLAAEKRLRVRVSRDPILPDLVDGLFLCESRIAFVLGGEVRAQEKARRIFVRRFLKISEMGDLRESVNFDGRMLDALLGEALEQLQKVRHAHFELEKIYSSAMDFAEKEKFTKKFCNRLFDLQNP